MGRIISNKHYNEAANVSVSSFTSDSINRLGEIVVVNDAVNPGLYIVNTEGKVINVSSPAMTSGIAQEIKDYIDKQITGKTHWNVITNTDYAYRKEHGTLESTALYFTYDEETSGSTFVVYISGGTMVVDDEMVAEEVVTMSNTGYNANTETLEVNIADTEEILSMTYNEEENNIENT